MRVHFSSKAFDYQTLRAMAYTIFGGAEPGEVLATAERISGGDTGSWHREWLTTAERVASAPRRPLGALVNPSPSWVKCALKPPKGP